MVHGTGIPPPTGHGTGIPPPTVHGTGIPPPTVYGTGIPPPTVHGTGIPPPTVHGTGIPPPTVHGTGIPPPNPNKLQLCVRMTVVHHFRGGERASLILAAWIFNTKMHFCCFSGETTKWQFLV